MTNHLKTIYTEYKSYRVGFILYKTHHELSTYIDSNRIHHPQMPCTSDGL